jgi:hypothetical protein
MAGNDRLSWTPAVITSAIGLECAGGAGSGTGSLAGCYAGVSGQPSDLWHTPRAAEGPGDPAASSRQSRATP